MLNGSATLSDMSNICILLGESLVGMFPEYRLASREPESICQV